MTNLENNLLTLAIKSEDVLYKGLIYSGGYVCATNKKILVRTRLDYDKSLEGKIRTNDDLHDVDKITLYELKEVVNKYDKERGRENIDLQNLKTILLFIFVYNKYAKSKLGYVRLNDVLFSVDTLEFVLEYTERLNLFVAGISKIKTARVLICRNSDTIILNAECRPDTDSLSYVDYKDCSIVFGDMNIQKLKSTITKKMDKVKDNATKTKEYQKELSIIQEFINIER